MREIISLHIGQAGVQTGRTCWELYCAEHKLDPSGVLNPEVTDYGNIGTFFSEVSNSRHVPRSLFVDLEPTVIDKIKSGEYAELFHPENLISGFEDAANIFARGKFTVGKDKINSSLDKLRKLADQCEGLQGLIVNHSFGGGTGSGFTNLLAQEAYEDFSKKTKMQMVVYPSPIIATSVLEPYNSILCTHGCMNLLDVTFLSDNEAVYEICKKNLECDKPSYMDLNRLIAQATSSITSSLRFEGTLNVDINEFQTNLIPFPNIHYPLISYAPITSAKKANREQHSIADLTYSCFEQSTQLVKCDQKIGKYMSCCLLYRGQAYPQEINKAIECLKAKRNLQFVSWCSTGFKVGINTQPPVIPPGSQMAQVKRALCVLSNTTAICEAWTRLLNKFEKMYKKRVYVHWYLGEGMEENEFLEAQEGVQSLINEYRSIQSDE